MTLNGRNVSLAEIKIPEPTRKISTKIDLAYIEGASRGRLCDSKAFFFSIGGVGKLGAGR